MWDLLPRRGCQLLKGTSRDTAAGPGDLQQPPPPGTAHVSQGLIPDDALRKGYRIFTEANWK